MIFNKIKTREFQHFLNFILFIIIRINSFKDYGVFLGENHHIKNGKIYFLFLLGWDLDFFSDRTKK